MFLNIAFDYKMIVIAIGAIILFGIAGFISDSISYKKNIEEKKEGKIHKITKIEKKPIIKERKELEKLPEDDIFDTTSGISNKYERLPEDDLFKF